MAYAKPPFEVLRSCIDATPKNASIKLTNLDGAGASTTDDTHCEDQFDREFNGHIYGKAVA